MVRFDRMTHGRIRQVTHGRIRQMTNGPAPHPPGKDTWGHSAPPAPQPPGKWTAVERHYKMHLRPFALCFLMLPYYNIVIFHFS